MFDLIIRGGDVVTPHGVMRGDVAVRGETIAAVGAPGALADDGNARVIDAAGHIEETLTREAISRKQVAVADRIVLSKLDLVGGVAAGLAQHLAALNPSVPVLPADHGRIEAASLFGIPLGVSRQLGGREIDAWLAHGGSRAHHHDADITSFSIVRAEPLQAVALALFLEALAEHCGGDLLRLKGIVGIAEAPERPAVIHGVQHVFHPPAWLEHWPSADRRSRLVFITRRIPRRWTELLLEAISAEVADASASRMG